MRLLKTIVPALLALLMLGMAVAPISAQMDEPAEMSDFEEIEGLQRVYVRSFTPDLMAMFAEGTPEASPTGWFMLLTMAMEFDTDEHAQAGLDELMQQVESDDVDDSDLQLEDTTLDVDFDHVAKQAIQEEEGTTFNVLFTFAQDGKYVYAVVGMTMGDDPAPATATALTTMKEADAGEGEGAYSEDGTSEGGLWDKLPTLEQIQAEAPAFSEAMDEITFPMPEGTPAA